jgi:hypothetical protein
MPTFTPFIQFSRQVKQTNQDSTKVENFGLTYLSKKAADHFNQGMELYDECFHLFVGFNIHDPQNFRDALSEIKTYLDKGIHISEEDMGRIKQDVHAAAVLYAYRVRRQVLAEMSNWKTWENQLRAQVEKLTLEEKHLAAHLAQQKIMAAQKQSESQKLELTENMTKVENRLAQLNHTIVRLEKDIKELPLLKSTWCQHPQFFLYSNEALLYASDILADMEAHVQAAMEEYQSNKNKLPTEQGSQAITLSYPALQKERVVKKIPAENCRLHYAVYLRDFKKRIQQEKKKLCEVMLDRLTLACEKGDMTNQDIAYACEQALSAKGIRPFNTPLSAPRYETSAHTVAGFARYITVQGSKQQQARFNGLTLFQDQANLPLVVIHAPSASFLIPKALSTLVPTQPSWFPRLFRGYQRRHEFFQQQSDLLVECALLNQRTFMLNDRHDIEAFNTHWNTLGQTHASLITAYQNAVRQHAPVKNGLWTFLFQQKTQAFFTRWEAQLTAHMITVLDKQVDLIRQALPSVKQGIQPLEPLMENFIFSIEMTISLESKLAAIEASLKQIQKYTLQANGKTPFSLQQLAEKLNQTKALLINYLDQDQTTFDKKVEYKDMSKQLVLVAENKEAPAAIYQAIANYAERLQATDPNKAAQFIKVHQPTFNQFKSELMQLLGKVINQGIQTIQQFELNRIQHLYTLLNGFDVLTANTKWIGLCHKVATVYQSQRLKLAKSDETELFEKILEGMSDTVPQVAEMMDDLSSCLADKDKTVPWQSTYQQIDTQLDVLPNNDTVSSADNAANHTPTDRPGLTSTEQCHRRTQVNLDEFNQALSEWQQYKQMHYDRLALIAKFRHENDAVCNDILRRLAQADLPNADDISGEAETEYSVDEGVPGHERQRNVLTV